MKDEVGGMRVTRRGLVAGAIGAGLAGLSGDSAGQIEADKSISPDDLLVADRVAGRSYSESERKLMARSMTRTRAQLKAMRAFDLDGATEPAFSFDPRLPGFKPPIIKSILRLSDGDLPEYDGEPESLAFYTAIELGRLLKARKVTSVALTRMYLGRLKRFGPRLNCVVTLTEQRALEQATRADREIAAGKYRGPLHGVPYGVKDLLATKGIRTTWGAKPYENQVFDYDATVVERLAKSGAVLLAKLSMGELAMGDVWFGGLTRNPWRPSAGSSGSSAGPGCATAAGLVGFAIGTETLGSIVSPSVVNGVTGLRPTFGRVSRHGAMALAWTMDKIGPMCRGVEDCAIVLRAICGPDGRDSTASNLPFGWNGTAGIRGLRFGIDEASFASIERNAQRAPIYAAVRQTLLGLGIELKAMKLPPMNPSYGALAGTIIDVEGAAAFAKLTASGKLDQLVQQREGSWPNTFRVGSTIPASDYVTAMRIRRRLQVEMQVALRDVDAYVTVPHSGPSLVYTNLTGHPTLCTRCGMLNGLPQMIEFTGGLYQEEAILRLGLAFEQATPWHKEWPDTEKLPEVPPDVAGPRQ